MRSRHQVEFYLVLNKIHLSLGVILESSQLTMTDQVFVALRLCTQSLTLDAAARLITVHLFISGRLDYCNGLLCGMSDTWSNVCSQCKTLLPAGDRHMTNWTHLTSPEIIAQLPVRQCVVYKMLMLVHKCLNSTFSRRVCCSIGAHYYYYFLAFLVSLVFFIPGWCAYRFVWQSLYENGIPSKRL